jgi:hypothetical protein
MKKKEEGKAVPFKQRDGNDWRCSRRTTYKIILSNPLKPSKINVNASNYPIVPTAFFSLMLWYGLLFLFFHFYLVVIFSELW